MVSLSQIINDKWERQTLTWIEAISSIVLKANILWLRYENCEIMEYGLEWKNSSWSYFDYNINTKKPLPHGKI